MKALDPIVSPDPVEARAAMEDAAFSRDRMRTVLPRLNKLLKQVEAEEYAAAWEAEYGKVKVVRDQLATEMRELYLAAVAQLTSLFPRMAGRGALRARAAFLPASTAGAKGNGAGARAGRPGRL